MKIVLSRLDRLGDLILSTPAIRTIRRSFPDAHVTLLCSSYNHAAVANNPDLDAIEVVAVDEAPQHAGRRHRGADLAIALAPRTADLRLIAATQARRRFGYTYVRRWGTRLLAKMLLTDALLSGADPQLSERDPARPVKHEVEQLLELVGAAGATTFQRELVLPVPEADHASMRDVPEGAVIVHLAPRWFTAGSDEALVHGLLGDLRAYGRPLVITHATECRPQAEALRPLVDRVVSDVSFTQWAATFARASCVVTVDTGATHVASAMHRPTVVLFEHRYFALNSREWAPYGVPSALVRKPPHEDPESLSRLRQELRTAVGSLIAA